MPSRLANLSILGFGKSALECNADCFYGREGGSLFALVDPGGWEGRTEGRSLSVLQVCINNDPRSGITHFSILCGTCKLYTFEKVTIGYNK